MQDTTELKAKGLAQGHNQSLKDGKSKPEQLCHHNLLN